MYTDHRARGRRLTLETVAAPPQELARGEGRAGLRAMVPIVAGLAPFALVLGTTIAAHDAPVAGWAGILPIFGGSAHLGVLRSVEQGAGPVPAIVVGVLVQARLAIYSASLAPLWRDQPRWFRLVGAGLVVDQTWALAQDRASHPGSVSQLRRYFLGAGLTLAVGWTAMVTAGIVLGARLDDAPGLDLAVPLCMAGLLGPRLAERGDAAIVVVAGIVTWVGADWPAGTAMLAAIGAGVAWGAAADRRPA